MEFDRSNGGASALAFARTLTGKPYIYGGNYPADDGTDCSGLVQWAYRQVGVTLPRDSEDQAHVEELNNRVLNSEVGDLLFIPGDPIDANPGHVVIYVSPGVCFEAEETGTFIGQFPFDTDAWEFRTRPAFLLPEPEPTPPHPLPAPKGTPPQSALIKAGLVLLPNVAAAETATHNGWPLYYWASTWFVEQVNNQPEHVPLYANKNFRVQRPGK